MEVPWPQELLRAEAGDQEALCLVFVWEAIPHIGPIEQYIEQ